MKRAVDVLKEVAAERQRKSVKPLKKLWASQVYLVLEAMETYAAQFKVEPRTPETNIEYLFDDSDEDEAEPIDSDDEEE